MTFNSVSFYNQTAQCRKTFFRVGHMLPQSENTKKFLQSLLEKDQPDDFPVDVVKRLLDVS